MLIKTDLYDILTEKDLLLLTINSSSIASIAYPLPLFSILAHVYNFSLILQGSDYILNMGQDGYVKLHERYNYSTQLTEIDEININGQSLIESTPILQYVPSSYSYRTIYNITENTLGKYDNKVFIDLISPSRTLIRVRPVLLNPDYSAYY